MVVSTRTLYFNFFFSSFPCNSSAIRSPHVVVFYGLSLEPKLCVVMEYCAKGTLEEVLTSEDLDEVFDWAKFFQLAKGKERIFFFLVP